MIYGKLSSIGRNCTLSAFPRHDNREKSLCPNQLDGIAIRILDEGDDGGAGVHRPRLPQELADPLIRFLRSRRRTN
jgi:hypothetical protein